MPQKIPFATISITVSKQQVPLYILVKIGACHIDPMTSVLG